MDIPIVSSFARLRDDLRWVAIVGVCGALLLLPFVLLAQRPLQRPQVTLIGNGDSLSVLLEGAGGGRVLVGGGASQAEAPAALGRHFGIGDRRIDLVIVADRRDLPGATELVRRGMVREVATVGIYDQPAAAAALATLSDVCTAREVPLRAFGAAQRIEVGREARIALTVAPPVDADASPVLHLYAGVFDAPILVGPEADGDPALGAILLRANQEVYGIAAERGARLIAAPERPADLAVDGAEGRYLLVVGTGERATLAIEGAALRLGGAALLPLDEVALRR